MFPLFRYVLRGTCILFVAFSFSRVSAQTPAPALEVSDVRINYVARPPQPRWIEVDVELTVRASAPGQKYVNKAKVTLGLGVELSGQGKRQDFYKSVATAVALEEGKKANFRFYLPPEIVARDSITISDVKWYVVELAAGASVMKTTAKSVSTELGKGGSIYQSFKSRLDAESSANDGILLPQYLTVFAFDSGKPAPSFIRVEPSKGQ